MYSSIVLPFDADLAFDSSREESFFRAIPSHPGIFLIESRAATNDTASQKPYLARTTDLRRAAERLLRTPEVPSKRLNLRERAAKFCYRVTGSRFEQLFALYEHARECIPSGYRDFLRLRPPALLKINLHSSYPRCYVTRRMLADGGFYFGPFASRQMAETFAGRFLDLFKIRRCQIKIRPDPSFSGCIYSEMKMCLAPCFAGCTKEEYDAEIAQVSAALASQGASLVSSVEREREAASDATDFERAAALHRRFEKITGVFRGLPEIVRRADTLCAVILQRAAREKTVALFAITGGLICGPLFLCFDELSQPRSVEEIIRENFQHLAKMPDSFALQQCDTMSVGVAASSAPEACRRREEHLWILARWFYSKPREGEILFPEGDWPYRRIVRACARLLAQSAPEKK